MFCFFSLDVKQERINTYYIEARDRHINTWNGEFKYSLDVEQRSLIYSIYVNCIDGMNELLLNVSATS